MSNRIFQFVTVSILALVLGVAVVWLPEQLNQQQTSADQLTLSNPDCSITDGPCQATKDDFQVQLSVDATQIHSATPLTFEIEVSDPSVDAVALHLEGRDMYMGLNQKQFSRVEGSDTRWQGTTELAICTTGEMIWRAKVLTRNNNRLSEAQFYFSAQ